jgi:hypothetical protein
MWTVFRLYQRITFNDKLVVRSSRPSPSRAPINVSCWLFHIFLLVSSVLDKYQNRRSNVEEVVSRIESSSRAVRRSGLASASADPRNSARTTWFAGNDRLHMKRGSPPRPRPFAGTSSYSPRTCLELFRVHVPVQPKQHQRWWPRGTRFASFVRSSLKCRIDSPVELSQDPLR